MLKKFLIIITIVFTLLAGSHALFINKADAADIWVYTDRHGFSQYIVSESIRTNVSPNYNYVVVAKSINPNGEMIGMGTWVFYHDQYGWGGEMITEKYPHPIDVYNGEYPAIAAILDYLRYNIQ